MEKLLFIEPEKCRGCRLCEIVCSIYHEKVCNLSKARIHSIKWQNDGYYVPTTIKCDLCNGDPTCVKFCAPGALQFIEANDANLGKQKAIVKKYSNLINEYRKIKRSKTS